MLFRGRSGGTLSPQISLDRRLRCLRQAGSLILLLKSSLDLCDIRFRYLTRLRRQLVALIGPGTKIQEFASFRAEGAKFIPFPFRLASAVWALYKHRRIRLSHAAHRRKVL